MLPWPLRVDVWWIRCACLVVGFPLAWGACTKGDPVEEPVAESSKSSGDDDLKDEDLGEGAAQESAATSSNQAPAVDDESVSEQINETTINTSQQPQAVQGPAQNAGGGFSNDATTGQGQPAPHQQANHAGTSGDPVSGIQVPPSPDSGSSGQPTTSLQQPVGGDKSHVGMPSGELRWVGYDFDEAGRKVRVSVITSGNPKFELLQESNRAKQPEIVVRFLDTGLRRKSRRDIDASEFRSPVAYVRMREDRAAKRVDVILTMRSAVKPAMSVKDGNVRLTFDVPDYLLGPAQAPGTAVAVAEVLPDSDVLPVLEELSQSGSAGTPPPDPAVAVFDKSANQSDEITEEEMETVEASLEASESQGAPPPAPSQAPPVAQGVMPGNVQGLNERAPNTGSNIPLDEMQEEESLKEQSEDFDDGRGDPSPDAGDQRFEVRQLRVPTGYSLAGGWRVLSVAQDDGAPVQNQAQPQGQAPVQTQGNNNAAFQQFQNAQSQAASSQVSAQMATPNNQGNPANGNAALPTAQAPIQNSGGFEDPGTDLSVDQALNDGDAGGDMESSVQAAPEASDLLPAVDGSGAGSEVAAPTFSGKPVKLEFRNAPLSEVVRALAAESNVNIVFPPTFRNKTMDLSLKNVPWDEALKVVLDLNSLGMVRQGNVIIVDSLENITAQRRLLKTAQEAQARLVDTKVLIMRLSYSKASEIRAMVTGMLTASSKDDPRIRIDVDSRTNALIVEAVPTDLAKIRALVERLDTQTPQVEIAARIVEVARRSSDFLGIRWGGVLNFDEGRGLGFGNLIFPSSVTSDYAIDPGVGVTNPRTGTVNLRFGSLNDVANLDLRLLMEEQKDNVEILQSNKVIVQDNEPASISSGTTEVYQRLTSVQSTTGAASKESTGLDTVAHNLSTTVTPHVTADGMVEMRLVISSDNQNKPESVSAITGTSTRKLTTTLLRRSGETVVIGGIHTAERTENRTGIPFLSSIPIVGALFRSKAVKDSRKELLIMVTPKILNPAAAAGESSPPPSEPVNGDLASSPLDSGADGGSSDPPSAQGSAEEDVGQFAQSAKEVDDVATDVGDPPSDGSSNAAPEQAENQAFFEEGQEGNEASGSGGANPAATAAQQQTPVQNQNL